MEWFSCSVYLYCIRSGVRFCMKYLAHYKNILFYSYFIIPLGNHLINDRDDRYLLTFSLLKKTSSSCNIHIPHIQYTLKLKIPRRSAQLVIVSVKSTATKEFFSVMLKFEMRSMKWFFSLSICKNLLYWGYQYITYYLEWHLLFFLFL